MIMPVAVDINLFEKQKSRFTLIGAVGRIFWISKKNSLNI